MWRNQGTNSVIGARYVKELGNVFSNWSRICGGIREQIYVLTSYHKCGILLSNGILAQLGERLPYKQNVGGSIPSTPILYVAQ